MEDKLFNTSIEKINDFTFDDKVVRVFDDMVSRSVPFYEEIQRMITEQALDFAKPGTSVYDLGCSTGTTLLGLNTVLSPDISFTGIDESVEMLEKCRQNFFQHNFKRPFELLQGDFNQGLRIQNASVVIMCLTLQFVRPLYRERLLYDIYTQMNTDACFILIEKVLGEDSLFNRLFIKYYYDMKKRNHYSEMEIAQKREALENVLIPYKLNENRELLARTGFRYNEVFFKWYNFSGLIAVK